MERCVCVCVCSYEGVVELGKVHISKYINFPNPVFANNALLPMDHH